MAGGSGTYRDDAGNLIVSDAVAERLADRMAHRFHAVGQKLKGGTLQNAQGVPGPDPVMANQWGGKGIIKFNPSNDEVNAGIKQQISLFTWQSPDGLPHYVTVEVGRLAGGVGGPGADGTVGGLNVVSPGITIGRGSVGGGSWPAGSDVAGNPLSYRATAQVLIGTPGTMQDPFFMDINRGQRFTALASYVAVTAQMLGPPLDEQTGDVVIPPNYTTAYTSGSLAVYATLGAAVAPTLAPVLYTQYIDNSYQANIGEFVRIIPPRANFLLPLLSGNTSDKINLLFFDNSGNIIACTNNNATITTTGVTPYATTDVPLLTPIAIPADCYGVRLGTIQGLLVNYRLIYQLSV